MSSFKKNVCLSLNFYCKLLLFVALISSVNNSTNLVYAQGPIPKDPMIGMSESAISKKMMAKEVISPEKFSEPIASGYKAAQKAKDICSKLFCYCGCDLTDEHFSLLDCFTCLHGVDCAICQEEAIIALHMKEQGKPLALIQQTIDEKYSAQYPWDEPSFALERYLKSVKVGKIKLRTKYNTGADKVKQKSKKQGHCCGH